MRLDIDPLLGLAGTSSIVESFLETNIRLFWMGGGDIRDWMTRDRSRDRCLGMVFNSNQYRVILGLGLGFRVGESCSLDWRIVLS